MNPLLLVTFLVSPTIVLGLAASQPPFLQLHVDQAKTLSTNDSPQWPPMVSVPLVVLHNQEQICLTQLIKPPNVDDLYDWYRLQANQPHADPSWGVVWPTALTLSQYLLQHPQTIQGVRVVELGAGLGLAGLVAAACGAHSVTLTDREPYALHCALSTAACHEPWHHVVKGAILDWQDTDTNQLTADVVLATDVLYDGQTIKALAATTRRILGKNGGTLFLCDPLLERFQGARQTLLDTLQAKQVEILDLPLPCLPDTPAVTMDGKDHVARMQEPTVLLRCVL